MVPAAWTTRLIDAPAVDLMTAGEVARLFGFGEDTLRRLVKEGEFPPPVRYSPGTLLYDWRAVAFWRLKCDLFGRDLQPQTVGKGGATGGKSDATA